MSLFTTQTYLSPRFSSEKELAELLLKEQPNDATRCGNVGDCPRKAQYAIELNLTPKDEAVFLRAGNALHEAANTYYMTEDLDAALVGLGETWGEDVLLPATHDFGHLSLGHLEVIVRNYVEYARKRDTFTPIRLPLDSLKMERVLYAKWRVAPNGLVDLGESKLVMEFDVDGKPFIYAGKPDLPINMGGLYYIMDHKSTNSYLSDWYFEQFRFSNQLRGYCAMVAELTGLDITGALINGIYMGKRASLTEFKGDRFARYGPMMFQPGHQMEALRNQYAWRNMFRVYRQAGYFPQHTSKLCVRCPYARLCGTSPAARSAVMHQDYIQNPHSFLTL